MRYSELKYDGFEKYVVEEVVRPFNVDGYVYVFKFNNGYGASVIKHQGSYGNLEDKFELAVLYNDKLVYDTEITNDVIGWLNNDEVLDLLDQIKEL